MSSSHDVSKSQKRLHDNSGWKLENSGIGEVRPVVSVGWIEAGVMACILLAFQVHLFLPERLNEHFYQITERKWYNILEKLPEKSEVLLKTSDDLPLEDILVRE